MCSVYTTLVMNSAWGMSCAGLVEDAILESASGTMSCKDEREGVEATEGV